MNILSSFISLVLKSQWRDSQQCNNSNDNPPPPPPVDYLVFGTVAFRTLILKEVTVTAFPCWVWCHRFRYDDFLICLPSLPSALELSLGWRWTGVVVSDLSRRRSREMLLWSRAELGLNPNSTIYWHCGLGQVTLTSLVLVSPSAEWSLLRGWEGDNTHGLVAKSLAPPLRENSGINRWLDTLMGSITTHHFGS